MLTKSDFQKIGSLIDVKVTAIIDERVPAIIDQRVSGIISKTVPGIIKKELKPIEKRLTRIEKIIKIDFNYLDLLHIKNVKAINKIESHIGLPESELMVP